VASLHPAPAAAITCTWIDGMECSPFLRPRIVTGFSAGRILHAEEPVLG
jgi:hypothetical protein